MLSENQQIFLDVNKSINFLIVGIPSLVYNKLMWGGIGIEPLILYIDKKILNGTILGDVHLEYYHFNDDMYREVFDRENRLYLPTAERALVDTIAFLDKNYIEGPLIESLQNYLDKHQDLSKLYSVADHYKVPRDKIDYWINEAREETDMSMG